MKCTSPLMSVHLRSWHTTWARDEATFFSWFGRMFCGFRTATIYRQWSEVLWLARVFANSIKDRAISLRKWFQGEVDGRCSLNLSNELAGLATGNKNNNVFKSETVVCFKIYIIILLLQWSFRQGAFCPAWSTLEWLIRKAPGPSLVD